MLAELLRSSGPERFSIAAGAKFRLERSLQRDLDGKNAGEALDAGLRLAAAFDKDMRSPSIAKLIREIMRANPRAVALIKSRRKQPAPTELVRRFKEREGRSQPARAPSITESPPAGSFQLRTLIDTGNSKPRGRQHGR